MLWPPQLIAILSTPYVQYYEELPGWYQQQSAAAQLLLPPAQQPLYLTEAPADDSYSYFQSASAQIAVAASGVSCLQLQAAALTRRQRDQDQLVKLSDLASFLPVGSAGKGDSNTSAGGRKRTESAISEMELQQMLQHMAAHLESYYKPQGPRATDWFERLTAAYEHANAVLDAAAAEPAQVEKAAAVAASAVQRVYQGVNQSLKNMRWLVEPRMPSLSYLNSGRVMAILEQPAGLELQDQHGDKHYPDKVAFDDGCNLPLVSQTYCHMVGIPYEYTQSAAVQHSDGQSRSCLIGRTGPIHWTLGKETPAPLTLKLQSGMHVMKGNAGDMYDVCLDTNTLKRHFAHANPAAGVLCWYPGGPQLDFSTVCGVPATFTT